MKSLSFLSFFFVISFFAAHSEASRLPNRVYYCQALGDGEDGPLVVLGGAGVNFDEAGASALWSCETENSLSDCEVFDCWSEKL